MSGRPSSVVGIERLAEFPERIDVRSPAEYALDHVPGAASHPVLDDAERARVGTLHKQDSAFAARKAGAALVAKNIAAMLESAFASRPREWQPLVYCWRGGKRSGALTHVLNEIGWKAVQLEGGYKAYRRHVIDELARLPQAYSYRVICGVTGSGKSRLLQALAAAGAQVLDLEALARHRGSLLGDLPDASQPSQKGFESALCAELAALDPTRPVYIESESKKVGEIRVPQNLIEAMWQSPCVRVESTLAQRLALLRAEYAHFIADPEALHGKLAHLTPLRGAAATARWRALTAAGEWDALVEDLLVEHYDPVYLRSIKANYPRFESAAAVALDGIAPADFAAVAARIVAAGAG
ncbi:MAG: tRNA 2-selenouridine(34) synthase MnmH [Betaproteobacteria bacterium]|nr:tRNA 2-selenouridine(34) synthase MnmH [Betaproteobacteria bacterium]